MLFIKQSLALLLIVYYSIIRKKYSGWITRILKRAKKEEKERSRCCSSHRIKKAEVK